MGAYGNLSLLEVGVGVVGFGAFVAVSVMLLRWGWKVSEESSSRDLVSGRSNGEGLSLLYPDSGYRICERCGVLSRGAHGWGRNEIGKAGGPACVEKVEGGRREMVIRGRFGS